MPSRSEKKRAAQIQRTCSRGDNRRYGDSSRAGQTLDGMTLRLEQHESRDSL